MKTLNTSAIEFDPFPFNGFISFLRASEMIIETKFGITVPAIYPDLNKVYKTVFG